MTKISDMKFTGTIASPGGHNGHGASCYYCQKPCDNFAGDPGKWSVALPHADDPGVPKWHHMYCVTQRLSANQRGFVECLDIAKQVFETYRKEQNRWWRKMDGTPILNDIAVRMAEAFKTAPPYQPNIAEGSNDHVTK